MLENQGDNSPQVNTPQPNPNPNPNGTGDLKAESQADQVNQPVKNPQMAAVEANQPQPKPQPVEPQAPQAQVNQASQPEQKPQQTPQQPAKKIGKEKNVKAKKKFILGCAGAFVFVFVLFIVLMVLMISRSGASNPVMAAFGLDPGGVRNFLQLVVGLSFGSLSLFFLVLAVIGLFKWLSTQKTDKDRRHRSIRMTALSTISLSLILFVWALLAAYIGRIEIAAERVLAEIVVVQPDDLSNLEAPVEIRFSALNAAIALEQSGLQVESMSWDLDGDGNFETPVVGANPEVTRLYTQRETVNVGLQVKVAGQEELNIFNKLISIKDATFDATPSEGIAPLEVEFDASTLIQGTDVGSIDWDFDGDGIYELEGPDNVSPRYSFEQIGTYNVRLRVLDKNNNVENYNRDIEVLASDQPLLSAKIDARPSLEGEVPMQIRFDASGSQSLKATITRYEWDFGDGSNLQSGKSVSYIYSEPGSYQVKLMVQDNAGNQAVTTASVEALSSASAPESIITSTPAAVEDQLTGVLPFKVSFSGANSLDSDDDIIEYQWDFDGDGKDDAAGDSAEHTFEEAGTYQVRLTVADAQGQSSFTTLTVVVEEPGVKAVITAEPSEGTAPLTVLFDGSSSSTFNGQIVSYEWDFGDGSPKTITGAIISHKYNTVGNYEAKLKVLTNNNEFASTTKQIFVREIPLKACFTPSRTRGAAPLTVSFDSKCSTGSVASYKYQYGDGIESTSASPTHTFDSPGTYTVILEVTDEKNNVNTYQEVIVAEGNIPSQ